MSTTMPQGSPGSLTPDDYASLVAFYLRQSGYPAGENELATATAALRAIRVDALQK
jgi:hypothetical protein